MSDIELDSPCRYADVPTTTTYVDLAKWLERGAPNAAREEKP